MTYQLEFSGQAIKDIKFHKNSGNKALLKKLFQLLEELTEHLTSGIGKPDFLPYYRFQFAIGNGRNYQ
ncbi:hypothetical protein [Lunatimonas salinarum]|uniref:hypothetical protein n=1 Tax=Lunatimonas salinarum TaxID=1774590 RepID=UPI001ADF8DAB|nr:hypothetical protein [Lunatimonas salinarum]